ncbi:MAG: metallophosphoesterase [Polyangiaceae bacterium]
MPLLKIVHAADIHLDSPLRGLSRYEGAPAERVRGATRRALENLVDLCLSEGVSLLLLAGDLYDGNWKDYSTGLYFASQMSRLRAGGTRVFLVRGNHDAQSEITRHLRWPEHVRDLTVREPETVVLEDVGVAVHGQGFATKSVTDDLAAGFPMRVEGAFNIGLLHTSLTGREGHADYAPCRLETLRSRGYDYWALGHVHAREVVSQAPWVVFPGNLQGRHARETGPKGATLLTVDAGRVTAVEHRTLDVVRWAHCRVDVGAAADAAEAVDLVRGALEEAGEAAEGRALAARITLEGATHAHGALHAGEERLLNEVRLVATDVGADAWVERLVVRTRGMADAAELAEQADAVGELVRSLRAIGDDPAALGALGEALAELSMKLPPILREGDDALGLDDPARIAAALGEVEAMILPRLLDQEDEP